MQDNFVYQGIIYTYTITKSKRKRVSIVISGNGEIAVKLPLYVSYEAGKKFVQEKKEWIVKQHLKMLAQQQKKVQSGQAYCHTFLDGDTFYYRGDPCRLSIRENPLRERVHIEKSQNQIIIAGPPLTVEQKRLLLEEWFKKVARIRYEQRCAYYAPQLGVHYQTIRIKNQKSRWGSCSSKQNLNFNWRLIMAPDSVLDYVVVHELCHLKEMNHSQRFWNLVFGILPDYKEQEKWLKEHQETILQY